MAEPHAESSGDPTTAARQLLEIIHASWMAQAAYVAAHLQIPDVLAAGPKSDEDIARATGAHPPSLRRLLRALVTIDICRQRDDGCYELTQMGSLLRADAAGSLRAWTLHWGGPLWSIWGDLLRSVMTGESARKRAIGRDGFDRLDADPEAAAIFNRAMVELTRLDSAAIVRACDFSGMKRIVDVGGGYGELLAAILQANPGMRGVLFDRPHAIEDGKRHAQEAAVADRCEFVAGDFFESVPGGAEAYVLKSVIHDWNDELSERILRNCCRAMDERAKLLLIERIVPVQLGPSAAHRAMARADLNMLIGTGGQERTEHEYRTLLGATNLRVEAVVPAGPTFSIIEAMRSG